MGQRGGSEHRAIQRSYRSFLSGSTVDSSESQRRQRLDSLHRGTTIRGVAGSCGSAERVDTQAGCTRYFAGIAEASNRLKQHEDRTLTDKKTIKRVPGLPRHPKHDEMSGMMKDWYYHVPFEGTLFPVRSDPDIEADGAKESSLNEITGRKGMAKETEVGLFAGVCSKIDELLKVPGAQVQIRYNLQIYEQGNGGIFKQG